jgi:hypothetical protein
MANKEKRFVKVKTEGGGFTGPAVTVFVDRQTGVNYIYASSGYGGGLTPLLNRDGTPIVTPVPKTYDE